MATPHPSHPGHATRPPAPTPRLPTSIWRPLRHPAFRTLWVAALVSGCFVSAHDLAATWLINDLSHSAVLVSLMSTMAALPAFLFTLPAGAFADIVDRRRLMIWSYLALSATAGTLALLGVAHLISPPSILVAVFLLGTAFAVNGPAWTATIPSLVGEADLPAAMTLGGLQMNVASICGPALGALLLPLLGPYPLFGLNAVAFLLTAGAVARAQPACTRQPLESFFEALISAARYVRYAPGVQVTLVRQALFGFHIAVLPALLPVVALKEAGMNAASLGILFTFLGVGSVGSALLVVPRLRQRFSPNTITAQAGVLLVVTYGLLGVGRHPVILCIAAVLGGAGWSLAAAELWIAGQRAMPSWARGRINATQIMVAQGGVALGGIVWGALAHTAGVQTAVFAGAALLGVSLLLDRPLSIDFSLHLNLKPSPLTTIAHRDLRPLDPQDGPVVVYTDFEIAAADRPRFFEVMSDLRKIYLRNGAYSFWLEESLADPERITAGTRVRSWGEHLLQHERMTEADMVTWRAAEALHRGSKPVPLRHLLMVRQDLARKGRRGTTVS